MSDEVRVRGTNWRRTLKPSPDGTRAMPYRAWAMTLVGGGDGLFCEVWRPGDSYSWEVFDSAGKRVASGMDGSGTGAKKSALRAARRYRHEALGLVFPLDRRPVEPSSPIEGEPHRTAATKSRTGNK